MKDFAPMSGEGWDDNAKTYKEDAWETRQQDRGGSWWMKQAALYAQQNNTLKLMLEAESRMRSSAAEYRICATSNNWLADSWLQSSKNWRDLRNGLKIQLFGRSTV